MSTTDNSEATAADRLGALENRVSALEALVEGKLENAVTREEVFGAFADKVLERNREKRRTPE